MPPPGEPVEVQCLGEMPWWAGRLRSSPTRAIWWKADEESILLRAW